MKNVANIGFLMVAITFCHVLTGQTRDAGLWISAEGEFRLNPRWSVVGSTEVRMHENWLELGAFIAEVGLERNLGDRWRLAGGMRLALNQQTDRTYVFRNRFFADVRYRYRVGKFDVVGRIKYQQQNEGWIWEDRVLMADHYLRAGAEIRWRATQSIRPYIGSELYFPLYAWQLQYPDKLRVQAGIEYRINKAHSFDLGFLYQQEINVSQPERDYVACLGYVFSPRW